MKPKDRYRLLERAVQAQAARSDAETATQPTQLGDVFSLPSTAEFGVLWAWIENSGAQRATLVAADLHPWVGSADVEALPEASCGALSLRCAIDVDVAVDHLQKGTRAGRLPDAVLQAAQLKRTQMRDGTPRGSWSEQDTDEDPEYQAWLDEGPRQAQAVLRQESAHRHGYLINDAFDAVSGGPWTRSVAPQEIVDRSLQEAVDPGLLQLLQHVHRGASQPHLGMDVGAADHDPTRWGWGLVVGSEEPSETLIALQPLINHRRRQLGDEHVKILDHRPQETWRTWLARHGVAPGHGDPTKVPYYLLIVGSPRRIPFDFQQILGVEYAVGRLSFEASEGLATYARSVVSRELDETSSTARRAIYFAPGADPAAGAPAPGEPDLDALTPEDGWQLERLEGREASRERLVAALEDPAGPPLDLMVAVTQGGVGEHDEQGALGGYAEPSAESMQSSRPFAASDAAGELRVGGSVQVLLAAHSAATSGEAATLDDTVQGATEIEPSVAALPRRLLAHPSGSAHAVIGRVGPGWHQDGVSSVLEIQNLVRDLAQGYPVGHALQQVRRRYASLATELAAELDKAHMGARYDAARLAVLWGKRNNLRDLILLGDPVARIPQPEVVSEAPEGTGASEATPSPGTQSSQAQSLDPTAPLPRDVTVLLEQWNDGDPEALDQLMPMVFDELRAMAHNFFRKEASNQTLQTTALVHEVYLRLQGRRTVQWRNRSHFFGSLAKMIRRILVDRARRRKSVKRGGGVKPLPLDDLLLKVEALDPEILALDEALEKLEKLSPRQHEVVELKFFMGLTQLEIAKVLDVAKSTVIKDWANARAFLLRELSRGVDKHSEDSGGLSHD